jgi:hypothetical protein
MKRWSVFFVFALSLWLALSAKVLGAEADETTPVSVPEPSALALRYHQTGNWIWLFARVWDLAIPAAILFSGLSARIWNIARRVGRFWIVSAAVYFALFVTIGFLADLPLRYYTGYFRQHAYGLSNQMLGKWLNDELTDLVVSVLGAVCFAWIPFVVIRRFPRFWWLIVSALMVPFLAFVMLIAPVWIDPLYNDFGPMEDKALEAKILALAHRAGIADGRVFEVEKSVDTKTANAYVKGMFGSKRIVLWDTLTPCRLEHRCLLDRPARGPLVDRPSGAVVDRSILGAVRVRFAGRDSGHSPALAPDRRLVDGSRSHSAGVQPLSRARGGPLRPGADPPEPLRRPCVRRLPARELEHAPSEPGPTALAQHPPEHRRAHRVLQRVPSVA